MAKEGKDTTEFEQAKKADTMTIVGLALAVVIAYAPKVIEGLNGDSKLCIIAGAIVGALAILQSTLVKLGYLKSRTHVKVAENGKKK